MKHFHCPVNGWDCPYYVGKKVLVEGEPAEECLCSLEDPHAECDDFYAVFGDCEPEDYTDDTNDKD